MSIPNVPNGIEAVLAHKLKDVITKHCITNVSANDISKADYVILGKPGPELRDSIVVSIHIQHPLHSTRVEKERPNEDNEIGYPWRVPAETVGGMNTKSQVGAVQLNIRQDLDYDDAIYVNSAVTERVRQAIDRDAELGGLLTDDFGGGVSKIQTYDAPGFTGGGGDVSIYTRWIGFKYLLHTPNTRS